MGSVEWLWSMLAAWPATWLLIVLWASLRPHLCLAGILVMAGAIAVSPLAVPLPVTVAAAAALVASVFIAALLRAAAAREHEAVAPGPRSPADPRRGTSDASVTASPGRSAILT
jgi:hypothetical protein